MLKEKKPVALLQQEFDSTLQDLKLTSGGSFEKTIHHGQPTVTYEFHTRNRRVEMIFPDGFIPNFNSGREDGSSEDLAQLVKDMEVRHSLRDHMSGGQDVRHQRAVNFFISNWSVLSVWMNRHVYTEARIEPQAFAEVRLGQGLADFVGVASDGTVFVAEFGQGWQIQKKLHKYTRAFNTLYPEHLKSTRSFTVKPREDPEAKDMILQIFDADFSNIVSPANGDRPQP